MLNKFYKVSLTVTVATLPFLVNAQLTGTKSFFTEAKTIVTDILIPLVFALALLFFFWGVAKYIWSAGDAKEEGKQIMVWGVVALFVMSSIWGIIYFIGDELMPGQNYDSMPIPTLQ